MKFNLPVSSLTDCVFGIISKNSLPYLRSPQFSFMSYSGSFKLLHFNFRFIIHFELTFVKDVDLCINSFFLESGYSVVPAYICRRYHLYSFVQDQLTIFIMVYF